jgi:hypothetical protein
VLRENTNSFPNFCQRAAIFLFFIASLPAGAVRGAEITVPPLLRGLSKLQVDGSFSLNWRNVGPKKPGFETQIQDEVYLSDMYFGLKGPVHEHLPFEVEWHIPTGSQGRVQLNQLYFSMTGLKDWTFQFGKFLVPFGRYNELYKPDEFLTVTRPLLYASPDSLDLVVRVNSPRPPFSYGYTDVGARASYYPPSLHPLVPSELTAFVVNGLGESTNRLRTFPDPENLGIQSVPANGVTLDFGHRNNNLADNNNYKSVGARVVFGLGDVRLPWPLPEESADLKGITLGLSAMGGQFDLEGNLNYQMYGIDYSFDYQGFNFSGEYMYSTNDLLAPVAASSSTLAAPLTFSERREVNQGYFIQASFPLWRKPPIGRRLTGVLVYNQIFRRGPLLDLFLNYNDGNTFTVYPSLNAIFPGAPFVKRRITKYTAALNHQLTEHFFLKFEYSYWVMNRSTTRTATSLGLVDIYQGATSISCSF